MTIPPLDRDVLRLALNRFQDVDEEDLLEALATVECRVTPTQGNIQNVITELANLHVIKKTAYVAECWGPILKQYLIPILSKSLECINEELTVTTRKVLKLLCFPDINSLAEKATADAFKQYVKLCTPEKLSAFLRFVTGSDLILGKSIKVSFTPPVSDFTLRPVAHTCGCELHLSKSYDSLILLREHFDNILDSKMLRMDIG